MRATEALGERAGRVPVPPIQIHARFRDLIPPSLTALAQRLYCPLAVVTPFFVFLAFFTPAILDPTNIAWLLHGDWGQHFLGWHAFRQTPLTWPFNHQSLLAAPTGLSLIYTDSNPLLALPLRLLSPYLPPQFQFIGPWFLLCVVLHFSIAWTLLRRYAPGPWSRWAGALLLSLLPTLYNQISHDTLVAHWLILWAIYIFFEIEGQWQKPVAYAANLSVTALVHPYLLVMCLAIWSADTMRVALPAWQARQVPAMARTGAIYGLCLIPMTLALCLSGAFTEGQSAGESGFRFYSMGLDALVNPARPDFPLAILRGPQGSGQVLEGFQYLGAGLIGLTVVAAWLYIKRPQLRTCALYQRAKWLLWPFAILLALALTDQVQIYGVKIFGLPLPRILLEMLAVVRASGRLFWPIAYTGIFLALATVYRLKTRALAPLLGVVLVLQTIDLTPFAASTRRLTADANNRLPYRRIDDARWQGLIKAASAVEFEPHLPSYDIALFYGIVFHAVSEKVPVTTMYAARPNIVQAQLEEAEQKRFRRGEIDPGRLYVLLAKCPPAGAASRIRQLDGVWIIPPVAQSSLVKEIPDMPRFRLGETYSLDETSPLRCFLDDRWSSLPGENVQNRVASAGIRLPVGKTPEHDLTLTLGLKGMLKQNRLVITANGRVLFNEILSKTRQDLSIVVPAALITNGSVDLTITVKKDGAPPRPRDDARGIKLYTLRLQ